ncbi:MAG TPA: phosphoribosylanthranilate isomerase [Methyloprofundus sp.]|uniref:phosphoribosylanthranilate isomerase n=1 Tax=Methyloprofundus sp. TaxID=2020875 RepID=UPI0017ECB1DE|nr:phosphoribosylanthranilate isomerase [Methyloprofundus sp.]HIG65121.1 phosphoribosylanthranilate isomerase [Methyloprofundus sp.]HIL78409.1 phosphoribosylanthranilate isomerase [Methylococcales bacterium]
MQKIKRTRVKICGFTSAEQAVYAAYAGTDAIGLVFYAASPRHVSIAKAQEIVAALPAFTTVVALFVDATKEQIKEVIAQVAIDVLQFHGDESGDECRMYAKPYIKAIRMHSEVNIDALTTEFHDAQGLLLDAYHAKAKGGTGEQFNWDLIPEHCNLPIILAGGLGSHNARDAIAQVQPYALDVSSGVEAAKGIKDNNKIAAFLTEVYLSDRNN